MRPLILVVLSALPLALSAHLSTIFQARSLNQAVGTRDRTTSAQSWQVPATDVSKIARALLNKQRQEIGNVESQDGGVDYSQSDVSQPVDGQQVDGQQVGDQQDNSFQVAGGPIFSTLNDLSLQQNQFINTLLNKFGPDGPTTAKEAEMVAEFAKRVAGVNALTPEKTKAALNWLFKTNWEYNPFLRLMRAWTSTWKDD